MPTRFHHLHLPSQSSAPPQFTPVSAPPISPHTTPIPSASGTGKHRRVEPNENINPYADILPSFQNTQPRAKKRKVARSTSDKILLVLAALHDVNWTISDFTHFLFQIKDDSGHHIHRSQKHAQTLQHFFSGKAPGEILDTWMHHPFGSFNSEEDKSLMYSATTPFTEINSIQPCLTSFAVQIVHKQLIKEAEKAVHSSSGLHASAFSKVDSKKIEWVDIGATTVPHVMSLLKLHQPLTWKFMETIATRPPRVIAQVVQPARRSRNPEVVSTILKPSPPVIMLTCETKGGDPCLECSKLLPDEPCTIASTCKRNPLVWDVSPI
ncbi:hypothetical protein Hypma_010674 [Hypsizygus marmoreus]|uniref:Uncharacterized protein n=1 Tax=Hypsizygus marmoreus TaxID=39966 RepID=A0A369JJY7_HYPMA|nr:hypothetical protein Hypma_010674 [Hypsizygus marmoreus]